MKYKCKIAYSTDFVIGKYYEADDELSSDVFLLINGYWFYDFDNIRKSNINDYFYSTIELRRKKLEKLKCIE